MASKAPAFFIFNAPDGDRPFFAMLLLIIGVFVLALQDSLIKYISPSTSFWQVQVIRATGNLALITSLAFMSGSLTRVLPQNWRPVYFRGVMQALCMFCFFAGAPFLSIAQMAAGLYTYPLFVSLLAIPVLGETIGRWRLGALLVGAGGAIFMVNPLASNFSPVQLLPVAAGFFYACNLLILRHSCREENPIALTFAVAVIFISFGVLGISFLMIFSPTLEIKSAMPFVMIGWPELTLTVLVICLISSIFNLSGNMCMARAYQTANSSWLAPLDFTYLLFAALWGRVLFDSWPTFYSVIGMLLITTAGIVTAWREAYHRSKS
tara:strand:+ start:661 stop:1626 length:966 start_codon:yes stop_codon:yes gene_type:complete